VKNERGAALILALMSTLLLTALGVALALLSTTEAMITSNYSNAGEALYAADAAVERAVQDLLTVPRWDDILTGSRQSGFVGPSTLPTLPDGTVLSLSTATANLQSATDTADTWGANDPTWRLYAYGALADMTTTGSINSRMYVVVWVGDDPSDSDGNPQADVNGVLTLRAQAFGPGGTEKVIEVTVARTSSAESERGDIAERETEDFNNGVGQVGVRILSWREIR
jgi:Tfp pilus assembly protein PilX